MVYGVWCNVYGLLCEISMLTRWEYIRTLRDHRAGDGGSGGVIQGHVVDSGVGMVDVGIRSVAGMDRLKDEKEY